MSEQRKESGPDGGNGSEKVYGTSLAEWAVAAVGGLLLALMIGFLLFSGLTQPSGPPEIVLTHGTPTPSGAGYTVQVTARNLGHSTASAVIVRGELLDGDRVADEAELSFDYVPKQSERRGGLYFERDPAGLTLRLKAVGYANP